MPLTKYFECQELSSHTLIAGTKCDDASSVLLHTRKMERSMALSLYHLRMRLGALRDVS